MRHWRNLWVLIFILFCKFDVIKCDYYRPLSERISNLKAYFANQQLYGQDPYNFDDPDCNLTALQLITTKGYPGEEHQIRTKDNYILTVQRIPGGQGQKPDGTKKPAVVLQHGLGGCAVNWISNLANQSLGFILADAGYDVWLSNSRGNTYSTKHETLDPKTNPSYWQFSWDQMAKYDLPAVVDYVLQQTGNSQLYYAGHSQGTMIGFAQFSSDLDFAKKIKAFFALAPVAKVAHVSGGITNLAPYTKQLQKLFDEHGYFDFLPYNGLLHKAEYEVCADNTTHSELCQRLFYFNYKSTAHLNQTRIPVYVAHCPAGTSVQNMVHYGQAVEDNQFQMYDYTLGNSTNGKLNELHYGQPTPPFYNVSNLNVPTIVFHSDADQLADPTDVAWLISQINNTIVENYHYTDYTHGDFIIAMNASTDIYSHIVDYIKQHEDMGKGSATKIGRCAINNFFLMSIILIFVKLF